MRCTLTSQIAAAVTITVSVTEECFTCHSCSPQMILTAPFLPLNGSAVQ